MPRLPSIILARLRTEKHATLGTLEIGGPVFKKFATLEPSPPVIPAGKFPLKYEYSPKFKRSLWELKEVPGHTELKIHNGNNWAATAGCVLVGLRHGQLNLEPAVMNSRLALSQLTDALRPYEQEKLEIEVEDLRE